MRMCYLYFSFQKTTETSSACQNGSRTAGKTVTRLHQKRFEKGFQAPLFPFHHFLCCKPITLLMAKSHCTFMAKNNLQILKNHQIEKLYFGHWISLGAYITKKLFRKKQSHKKYSKLESFKKFHKLHQNAISQLLGKLYDFLRSYFGI